MHEAKIMLEGLRFGEGPRWHEGRLWLSDFFDHVVLAVSLDGAIEQIVEVPNQPSGLGWLPDGRLLVVSMTDRRLLRLDPDGLVEHADLSAIATFPCNDMVVDGSGRAYVGNFGFDLDTYTAERGRQASSGQPGPPTAALARVDPDGSVHTAASDLMFPNGSVITPDGRTLIVAETVGRRLTAFDIATDGSLANRREWASTGDAAPDGICLDRDGAIWVANPRAPECIRVAEGGAVLDRVSTSRNCYACALGGPDRTTLFMLTCAGGSSAQRAAARNGRIETAAVDVPGAGWP
ncbi:MAG: SMP-30/gluconolactonase/LRE family protein [Dehalococcoidia bacterium]